MVLSDTTTQGGLIQTVEFWSRLPYGSTGNTLKEIIARLNRGFDSIMPLLLTYADQMRWDDINHTDKPIGRMNLVSGQADYKIAEDDNNLDILNITKVRILESSTGTHYSELEKMSADDSRVSEAMSPNTNVSGTPTAFLEVGNILYLYPEPDYSATNGIEVFFEREQKYFTMAGSTLTAGEADDEPGIPKPFHELLALYASLDLISVRRPNDVKLINEIKDRILTQRNDIKKFIALRHPTRISMTTAKINHR